MSSDAAAVQTNTASDVYMSNWQILRIYYLEAKFEFIRSLRNPGFGMPFLFMPVGLFLLFTALSPLPENATNVQRMFLFTGMAILGIMGPGMFAFGAILADEGIALDLDRLVPFARWLPAHAPMRIFDTLFFLARAPDEVEATVDATENVRLTWTTAADLLAEADAGRATIIYPTRRNLERLALFAGYDAAVAQALAHPVRVITPFTEDRAGTPHLCIPDDLGYPVTAEPMHAAMRG